MSKPEPQRSDFKGVLLGACAVLLEAPVMAVLCGHGFLSAPWALASHLASATVMFLAPPREKGYFRPTRHWGEPLALLTLFIPGAGCLLAMGLYLSHSKAHEDRDAYRFEDDSNEDANWLAGLGDAADLEEKLADARDIIPAADALMGQDPGLKRGAIEVLAKMRSPEAIAMVIRARTDPDPEIRFYATTAMTRITRDYDTEVSGAEHEMYQRPGNMRAQLALHGIRCEYARSGLLEPATAAMMLLQSREWLAEPSAHDIDALILLFMVERQLDPMKALKILDQLSVRDTEQKSRWAREKVALAFEVGRYGEVSRLMQDLQGMLPQDSAGLSERETVDWRSATLWWQHG